MRSDHRERGGRDRFLIVFATLACLTPFLGKPLNIDDPVYVWTARQIRAHPLDYYGFRMNWNGYTQPLSEIMKNPPGAAYAQALIGALWGFDETSLHAGFLVSSIAAALGAYALARRLCNAPFLSAMTAIFTPAFLVSATGLSSEMLMLALWLWAIVLWIRGLDERRWHWLALSALLTAAATLTKYYAAGLIPLLAAYTLARGRSRFGSAVWLILSLSLIGAYEFLSRAAYGEGLIHSAGAYALQTRTGAAPDFSDLILIGLAFTGGSIASTFFFAPFLWTGRAIFVALGCTVVLAGEFATTGHLSQVMFRDKDGIHWGLLAQTSLMVVAGLHLLALTLRDLWTRRDADALLLALGVAGTLTFALFVNWTINARSLLPLAPLGGIMIVRGLEFRSFLVTPARHRIAFATLIPGALLGLAVAVADYRLSVVTREAVASLTSRYKPDHAWFLGHWGFQYYMEQAGAQPVDLTQGGLPTGDLLFVAENNSFNCVPWHIVEVLETIEVPIGGLVSTMSVVMHSGFHASMIGAIPFVIGRPPKEHFLVARITRSTRVKEVLVVFRPEGLSIQPAIRTTGFPEDDLEGCLFRSRSPGIRR